MNTKKPVQVTIHKPDKTLNQTPQKPAKEISTTKSTLPDKYKTIFGPIFIVIFLFSGLIIGTKLSQKPQYINVPAKQSSPDVNLIPVLDQKNPSQKKVLILLDTNNQKVSTVKLLIEYDSLVFESIDEPLPNQNNTTLLSFDANTKGQVVLNFICQKCKSNQPYVLATLNLNVNKSANQPFGNILLSEKSTIVLESGQAINPSSKAISLDL